MKLKTFAPLVLLALVACGDTPGNNIVAAADPVAPVAPPAGGDWTTTVAATPEGGFRMGNPNAAIKLVEFASFTCPHCSDFSAKASEPLKKLVATGKLSVEYRNYVRDAIDTTATLIARCNGAASFFGLQEAIFAEQAAMFARLQALPAGTLEGIQNLPPAQQFPRLGQITGLKEFAAQRGLPAAKADQCLADTAAAQALAKGVEEANKIPGFVGTPTFLINGQMVPNAASWEALEPALKAAGA